MPSVCAPPLPAIVVAALTRQGAKIFSMDVLPLDEPPVLLRLTVEASADQIWRFNRAQIWSSVTSSHAAFSPQMQAGEAISALPVESEEHALSSQRQKNSGT